LDKNQLGKLFQKAVKENLLIYGIKLATQVGKVSHYGK
jgi:hypothetical protein